MFKFILGVAVGTIITGALTYSGGQLDYKGDHSTALDNATNFYKDVKSSISSEE